MGVQSRSKRRNNGEISLALRSKELLSGSEPSSSKKRSGGEIEAQRPQKKFHLVKAAESKESTASSSAVQSTEDVTAHATMIGGLAVSLSAPFELPLRPVPAKSSLLPVALTTVVHSPGCDEQDEYDEDDEQFAFNYAMIRATDITKMLSSYDPHEDAKDEEERFGEPHEDLHSYFYEMVGLDAEGEEIPDEMSSDNSGDEFDSEENESDQSEYDDEEIDRACFIGDDEEMEEWDEHEYSDGDLDAEEGASASGDEESEFDSEKERKSRILHN